MPGRTAAERGLFILYPISRRHDQCLFGDADRFLLAYALGAFIDTGHDRFGIYPDSHPRYFLSGIAIPRGRDGRGHPMVVPPYGMGIIEYCSPGLRIWSHGVLKCGWIKLVVCRGAHPCGLGRIEFLLVEFIMSSGNCRFAGLSIDIGRAFSLCLDSSQTSGTQHGTSDIDRRTGGICRAMDRLAGEQYLHVARRGLELLVFDGDAGGRLQGLYRAPPHNHCSAKSTHRDRRARPAAAEFDVRV